MLHGVDVLADAVAVTMGPKVGGIFISYFTVYLYHVCVSFQCFDAVGWAAGRAFGL